MTDKNKMPIEIWTVSRPTDLTRGTYDSLGKGDPIATHYTRKDHMNAQLDEVIALVDSASYCDIDCDRYINQALDILKEMRGEK